MKAFYYQERTQTYINTRYIVTVTKTGATWTITTTDGGRFLLNDKEYSDIEPILTFEHKMGDMKKHEEPKD